jgi:hypothetical protein
LHLRKLRIETRNLLVGRPILAMKCDSKQTMVVLSTVGNSRLEMEDSIPPGS